MQGLPNRMGLGMRPPAMYGMGQGPSMSALAQQQQMSHPPFVAQQAHPQHNLFVGSISGGITDSFLNELLGVSSCDFPFIAGIDVRILGMWTSESVQTDDYSR